jgi:hypothetical protein
MLNRSPMLHQKQHGPASRTQRGQRLLAAVPHAHWKTSTFVAGLRVTGLTAPLVVFGAMNGVTFLACAEQCLAPTPGTRRYRRLRGIREALEARGAELRYLPAYSPDLNPTEVSLDRLPDRPMENVGSKPLGRHTNRDPNRRIDETQNWLPPCFLRSDCRDDQHNSGRNARRGDVVLPAQKHHCHRAQPITTAHAPTRERENW